MKRSPSASPRAPLVASLVTLVALVVACRAGTGTSAPESAASGTAPATPVAPATPPSGAPDTAPPLRRPPATPLERLIALGREDNRVQQHLAHLCIAIGPRLTGSARLQEACEWARDTFASYGLDARLEQWGEFPVGFERGPWRGAIVAPERVELELVTRAWSPGTDGPARGPALAFPASEDELAALEERIGGAWLVRPPARAAETVDGEELFPQPAQPSGELVEQVRELIEQHGGLGEVYGVRGERLVTSGDHEVEWDDLPTLVRVGLKRSAHDDLWLRMQGDAQVELEFDVDNRFVQGPIPLYNVVADLPGSTNPDEVVIVCGHLDSWDGAQGTVDNGTGCATTIEAARLLVEAGIRPHRTIRFILWTGEEQGLLGSRAYVEQNAELMPRVSAVLNHDGGTNYLAGLGVTPAMLPQMEEVCAPLLDLSPDLPFRLREVEGLPQTGSSDHAPFVRAGAPGFFWDQRGRSDYEVYHHTHEDVFEAAIPEYQEHSALVAAVTAWRLADLPEMLDRTHMKAPDPRRMGVGLDGATIVRVQEGSRAEEVGLLAGDVILSVDGVNTPTTGRIQREVSGGGSRKVVAVRRGDETLEFTLDWSDDPDEARRLEIMRQRDEERAARDAEREARRAERRDDE